MPRSSCSPPIDGSALASARPSSSIIHIGEAHPPMRRKTMQIEGQQEPVQGQPVQDTSTRPVPNDEDQDTIELDSNPPILDHCVCDDRPIALRKGTRTCTKRPICNFVSFDLLSPVYRSFVSSLDQVQVPSTIEDAFRDPK